MAGELERPRAVSFDALILSHAVSPGRQHSQRHITDWVHVTRPAAATAAGCERVRLGKGGGHPFADLSLGSRGVMNRRTLDAMKTRISRKA